MDPFQLEACLLLSPEEEAGGAEAGGGGGVDLGGAGAGGAAEYLTAAVVPKTEFCNKAGGAGAGGGSRRKKSMAAGRKGGAGGDGKLTTIRKSCDFCNKRKKKCDGDGVNPCRYDSSSTGMRRLRRPVRASSRSISEARKSYVCTAFVYPLSQLGSLLSLEAAPARLSLGGTENCLSL